MKNFKMPIKSNLKSRISTINNAFAISIIPYVPPQEEVLEEYYNELKIEPKQCGYCLTKGAKTVDHIFPVVKDGLPFGYLTDINNLIPCCKDCNSKKGGKLFKDWYKSKENIKRLKELKLNETTINERYNIISDYIKKHEKQYDFEKIIGKEKWDEFVRRKNKMTELLEDNQKFCDELNEIIWNYIIGSNAN
ncbi:MAG: HNH endonuclease [Acholeplasmatales bacterium]|nr:HNH endonuclease [Acholeplasmatales bacterium]